ncbi:MAG: DNA repair protein RecN [Actinomycetaceae bacterium]|nr:DNA repair protein RecN [Actinomycetaceae bacterium]
MIDELHIRDLGVIEEAHLELGPGLTVITGETGAGKTVLLTSIELLLGRRADSTKIRAQADEAIVDGVFSLSSQAVAELAIEGVEEPEIIITRRLNPHRSRAYLGRRPTPLATLQELAPHVAVVHGQADQLNLRSSVHQRALIDEFAGPDHAELLDRYNRAWKAAVRAKRERDAFEASLAQAETEIEEIKPILDTIDALDLRDGEEEELRLEAERITHAETLREALVAAYRLLAGGGPEGIGAADALGQASAHVERAENLDSTLNQLASRVMSLAADADALRDDIARYLENLKADPQRLDDIHSRRRQITTLLRGRAADIAGLHEWATAAAKRVAQWENKDDELAQLNDTLTVAQREILATGRAISQSRQAAARSLAKRVETELTGLSMKGARLIVSVTPKPKPAPDGLDDITMELQPHPDAPPVPLGHGASGGELSRLMLAIEVVLAEHTPHQKHQHAYIFDEIDAGVGGRAARSVGERLARLAQTRQVLVVTHLPQVAAWATTHLLITKNGTTTTVKELDSDERIVELARMLSGSDSSSTARAHAAELLNDVKVAQSKM